MRYEIIQTQPYKNAVLQFGKATGMILERLCRFKKEIMDLRALNLNFWIIKFV